MGYRDGRRAVGGVYLFPSGADHAGESRERHGSAVLLSARATNVLTDEANTGTSFDRRITLFQDEASSGGHQSLLSVLKEPSTLSGVNLTLGASLNRLDPLIRDALHSLSSADLAHGPPSNAAHGLAGWLRRYANGEVSTDISRRSVSYALFSASLRSRILSYLLKQDIGKSNKVTLVDHGANIGMLMLCATYGLTSARLQIHFSEIDHAAVRAAREIWRACGLKQILAIQPFSAVDFQHPDRVDCVFFGQMLFRVDEEERAGLIERAWHSLTPGGFLAINEIMNRTDAAASANLLSSDELFGYLPSEARLEVYTNFAKPRVQTPKAVSNKAYTSSENCVVVRKPKGFGLL